MFVALAICSVLLFFSQGDAIKQEEVEAKAYMKKHKAFLGEMKIWLANAASDMKTEVNQTVTDLQELPTILREEGKAQLTLQYLNSLQQVSSLKAPPQCIEAGKQKLEALHLSTINSFITCKNLTTGVVDIVEMGVEIGKLTIQILLTADEVINGWGDCFTWNPFKFFYCSFNWVKNTLNDLYDSFKAISDFNKNIAKLAADVKKQFDYCLHDGSTAAVFNHVNVINDVNTCSLKSTL